MFSFLERGTEFQEAMTISNRITILNTNENQEFPITIYIQLYNNKKSIVLGENKNLQNNQSFAMLRSGFMCISAPT